MHHFESLIVVFNPLYNMYGMERNNTSSVDIKYCIAVFQQLFSTFGEVKTRIFKIGYLGVVCVVDIGVSSVGPCLFGDIQLYSA